VVAISTNLSTVDNGAKIVKNNNEAIGSSVGAAKINQAKCMKNEAFNSVIAYLEFHKVCQPDNIKNYGSQAFFH
jgi:hypothetical protein